jgi:amino acid transporter
MKLLDKIYDIAYPKDKRHNYTMEDTGPAITIILFPSIILGIICYGITKNSNTSWGVFLLGVIVMLFVLMLAEMTHK